MALNLACGGDTAFALDYSKGLWRSDKLEDFITVALQNEEALERYIFGNPIVNLLAGLSNLTRLNTLRGSRRNISAHYDLGNDFYSLWLDPSMTYSAAIYKDASESLTQAQFNKYDRLIDRLGNNSGRTLEIGCGWGGYAERAMERGDFDIKGITLSSEQQQYAHARLGGRADIALEDYRAQEGKYDHIVSIEMFEAVGEKYWKDYFGKIGSMLKAGGKALVQSITIDEKRFTAYRNGQDFIRSFIFPGGMLPSPVRFEREAEKQGLRVVDRFDFGQDYARTLEAWLANFNLRTDAVKRLGYDSKFIRLWRFYLAACIAGFRTRRTDVSQFELCMRRAALAAVLAAFLFAPIATASEAVPAYVAQYVPLAEQRGTGRGTYMWMDIYDATLYLPRGVRDPVKPMALSLRYLRSLSGHRIADRTIEEIRKQGFANEVVLAAWHQRLAEVFPDVESGTVLTGVLTEKGETLLYRDAEQIGRISDPQFGPAFFGIWLSPKTSEPDLRAKLLE